MLTRLIIRNYAIIPQLDIEIQPGLTIITGETGAGKSILLGALGLALGKRADAKVLPDDQSRCIVEAHFTLKNDMLRDYFLAEGLDYDTLLICRREISSGGRSRSFINDSPVSLKVLQEVTSPLIELHHQHDNLALQSRDYQIGLLDIISEATAAQREYTTLYNALQQTQAELTKARNLEITSARRKEFLAFQVNELESAKLTPGEIASLEESQNMLEHAESIDQVLNQIQSVLNDGSHAINNQLTALIRQTEGVRNFFPPIAELSDRLQTVRVETQDLALEASRIEGPGQYDPARLARIQSRLNQLYSLMKKYQCTEEEQLLNIIRDFKAELTEITSVHETITALEASIERIKAELLVKASSLSKKRAAGGKKLIPKTIALLQELGMPNAQFDIDLKPLPAPGPQGTDEITFLFSANKGTSLQPLQSVASGGELSRLSLALKSVYAAQAQLPTIIFDEIDTGISGEVAWRMGQLIRALAKGHQILMITHSPQIAAHASIQYHVSKVTSGDRDVSDIQVLRPDQRVIELAKMLSGDPPSKAAISNAEALIEAVQH